jgi:hypothetical protein
LEQGEEAISQLGGALLRAGARLESIRNGHLQEQQGQPMHAENFEQLESQSEEVAMLNRCRAEVDEATPELKATMEKKRQSGVQDTVDVGATRPVAPGLCHGGETSRRSGLRSRAKNGGVHPEAIAFRVAWVADRGGDQGCAGEGAVDHELGSHSCFLRMHFPASQRYDDFKTIVHVNLTVP